MKFSVAPMIDWTDRHARAFYRLMSDEAWLFSEMITTSAILFGDKERLLSFKDEKHKTALQLGGNNPSDLAQCARIGQEYGYNHINLNVGCPSDRVQQGSFGACLMLTPNVVTDCIKAMQDAVSVEVSVKHRIGVDEVDSYEALVDFIGAVSQHCTTFIVHARKAWLQGLSPKQNREIPPLQYDKVYQLKKDFPHLSLIINGGIHTYEECRNHLQQVDGVMLGRAVYHNPYLLATLDVELFQQQKTPLSREQILVKFIDYMQQQMQCGVPLRAMTRHILGLYYAQSRSKEFKRILSGKTVSIKDVIQFLEE